MPEISLRAEQMPASPIRKLVPLADAARARGTKIYHLNIGQPDLPSPKEGLESLKHIDRKVLEYSPSDGYRSLREKLVTYYEQYQIKLSPEAQKSDENNQVPFFLAPVSRYYPNNSTSYLDVRLPDIATGCGMAMLHHILSLIIDLVVAGKMSMTADLEQTANR